jgi:excisionase family DNA binding protein
MADHDDDVTPARGVLLSEAAVREIVAAIDALGQLAAPRQRLSERLQAIRSELIRSAVTSAARDSTHAHASADGIVAQPDSHWEASVVDTATAARVLGISSSGVRWAVKNGRLAATRCGGRWLIDTAALRYYQRERLER